jgi:hypothetical protein
MGRLEMVNSVPYPAQCFYQISLLASNSKLTLACPTIYIFYKQSIIMQLLKNANLYFLENK